MASRRIAVCLEGTPEADLRLRARLARLVRRRRPDESAALEALASYAERYAPWRWVRFTSTVALDVV